MVEAIDTLDPAVDSILEGPTPRGEYTWIAYADGLANKWASDAGIVLNSPDAMVLEYAIRFEFRATNNEAGYEAVLTGISIAHFMGADGIIIRNDS